MARSEAEIISLYYERRKAQSLHIAAAIDVRDQYNGDIVVPLPELDRNEKPAIANLLAQGLDQEAMRIASTQPSPFFDPLKPGIKKSIKDASNRRGATLAWWKMNKLPIKARRRARHLIGYASTPVTVVPDFKRRIPMWQVRDPLMTYPAPSNDPDEIIPTDCIFAYHQSLSWLKANYPKAATNIARRKQAGKPDDDSQLFQILEYNDAEETVLLCMGEKKSPYDNLISGNEIELLVRVPNLAGRCTAVVPGRVTLDRPQGQFDGMTGMFQQQAKLNALAVIATQKGIFRDEWVVARSGEMPKIIQMADGAKGELGVIQGAEVTTHPLDPSYMASPMMDRLERSQRLEGGVPAEFGGESSNNIRTGRRGDAIMSAIIDFPVQEAQELLALSREEEDKIAIAIDKGYWNRPKTFYIPATGKNEPETVEYVPQELWVTDEHSVTFSHAGADVNGLSILLGQLIGMGLISKRYAMDTHPLIEDSERMHDETIAEGLEASLLAGLQQAAGQPGANVADIAEISRLVLTDRKELAEAILEVHKKAQERQASQDSQGAPTGVDPNSPEAQPGMAAPGMGAEAGAAIQPPSASTDNLSQLLGSLRRPQMSVPSERGAA